MALLERAPVDRSLRARAGAATVAAGDALMAHPAGLLAAGLLAELVLCWVGSQIDVTRVPGVVGALAAVAAAVVAAIDLRVGVAVALAGGVFYTVLVSYGRNGGPDPALFGLPPVVPGGVAAAVV